MSGDRLHPLCVAHAGTTCACTNFPRLLHALAPPPADAHSTPAVPSIRLKHEWNTCNMKTLAIIYDWNIWNILLQHMCETYITFRLNAYVWNRWNILNKLLQHTFELKHLQHMQHSDLLWNINMKHLQHTFTSYAFSVTSPYCLKEWRLVVV
jgi:hypothetical protein